jgi:hypothetical protein
MQDVWQDKYITTQIFSIFTDTPITITSRTCGETYDMDMYKNTDVYYDGSDVLYENPCQVQFTKSSYEQFICIRGDDIRLDCDTELEYHEAFVKNYIDPEVRLYVVIMFFFTINQILKLL